MQGWEFLYSSATLSGPPVRVPGNQPITWQQRDALKTTYGHQNGEEKRLKSLVFLHSFPNNHLQGSELMVPKRESIQWAAGVEDGGEWADWLEMMDGQQELK